MSEVKPMNLSGRSHNPLVGPAAQGKLAENMREAERLALQAEQVANQKHRTQQQILMQKAQLKMQQDMNKYRVTAMERAESDYQKKKMAENYIFANYPGISNKSLDHYLENGLEYGIGGYDAAKKKWVDNVGAHSWQAFESHYKHQKQAEMQSLQNAMVFDPRGDLTEAAWRKNIKTKLDSMDPQTRHTLLNSLDGPTRSIFNDQFPHTKTGVESFQDTVTDLGIWAGDNPVKTVLGGTATVIATGFALRKQPAKVISKLWQSNGKVTADMPNVVKNASIKLAKKGEVVPSDVKNLVTNSAKELDLMEKNGVINKAQRKILEDGGSVVPDYYKREMVPKSNMIGPDVVTHKNVKFVTNDINTMVKDGVLNQADADKLKGVINTILKEGGELSGETVGQALAKGGSKYTSLVKSLNRGSKSWIGGLNTAGITRGLGTLGLGYGAYTGGRMLGDAMGFEEEGQEISGIVSSNLAFPAQGALSTIHSKIKKHGMSKVIQLVARKGGASLAARMMAKGALTASGVGSALGAGLLAAEVAYIAYLISQMD